MFIKWFQASEPAARHNKQLTEHLNNARFSACIHTVLNLGCNKICNKSVLLLGFGGLYKGVEMFEGGGFRFSFLEYDLVSEGIFHTQKLFYN